MTSASLTQTAANTSNVVWSLHRGMLSCFDADRCTKGQSGVNQACNAVGSAEGLCVNATAAGEVCTAAEGESLLQPMFCVFC